METFSKNWLRRQHRVVVGGSCAEPRLLDSTLEIRSALRHLRRKHLPKAAALSSALTTQTGRTVEKFKQLGLRLSEKLR